PQPSEGRSIAAKSYATKTAYLGKCGSRFSRLTLGTASARYSPRKAKAKKGAGGGYARRAYSPDSSSVRGAGGNSTHHREHTGAETPCQCTSAWRDAMAKGAGASPSPPK